MNRALRLAAQTLERSTSYLGAYYRKMRARHGAPRPSRLQPTNSRASFSIWSPQEKLMTKVFSPQKSNVSANEWKTNSNVPPSS